MSVSNQMTKKELLDLVSKIRNYWECNDVDSCIIQNEINTILEYVLSHHYEVAIDYETYVYFTYVIFYCNNLTDNPKLLEKMKILERRISDFSERRFSG